jgi:hypothetical protein
MANDSSAAVGEIISAAIDVGDVIGTFVLRENALERLGLPGVLGILGGDALANTLANVINRGVQIRIQKDGNATSCVNVKGAWPGDGGDVIVYPCTNNWFYPVNEAWQFVSTATSPWYLLASSLTDFEVRRGMCVKAQGADYTGSQLWTMLHHDCNPGDPLQQFTLLPVKDDIFLLFHRGSGQCMSRYDGQKLRTAPCNTGDNNQWLQLCIPGAPCMRPSKYMCSH